MLWPRLEALGTEAVAPELVPRLALAWVHSAQTLLWLISLTAESLGSYSGRNECIDGWVPVCSLASSPNPPPCATPSSHTWSRNLGHLGLCFPTSRLGECWGVVLLSPLFLMPFFLRTSFSGINLQELSGNLLKCSF